MYEYFASRKRLGVLGAKHRSIKDAYIVPLGATDPIPEVIQNCGLDGPVRTLLSLDYLLRCLLMHKTVIADCMI